MREEINRVPPEILNARVESPLKKGDFFFIPSDCDLVCLHMGEKDGEILFQVQNGAWDGKLNPTEKTIYILYTKRTYSCGGHFKINPLLMSNEDKGKWYLGSFPTAKDEEWEDGERHNFLWDDIPF